MEVRRLTPNDASEFRCLRLRDLVGLQRETRAKNRHIEPRAVKVDGRAWSKNHMYLERTPS